MEQLSFNFDVVADVVKLALETGAPTEFFIHAPVADNSCENIAAYPEHAIV